MPQEPHLIDCQKDTLVVHYHIKLSKQMLQMLTLLRGGATVPNRTFVEHLGLSDSVHAEKQVAVQMCKMRKRLQPLGLTIDCVVGKGYRLVKYTKA